MAPLVSVILCTYDQGQYLEQAIRSVLDQSYTDLDLTVVDNGSRDATSTVLERYTDVPRVRIVRHPTNGPVTKRLNQAIAGARGEYISLLYGDDYYLPRKLERQIQVFADSDLDLGVVYGPGFRLDARTGEQWLDRGMRCSGWVAREVLDGFQSAGINPIAPLVRRACFDRYQFYEDIFVEGEGIFLRIALRYRFLYLPEPLVVMREHPSNRGKAYLRNTENTMIAIDRLAAHEDFPSALRPLIASVKARLMRNLAWQLLRVAADPRSARRYFVEAIRWQRRQALHPKTLLGWGLSLLPAVVLAVLNRIGSFARGQRSGLEYREDYS